MVVVNPPMIWIVVLMGWLDLVASLTWNEIPKVDYTTAFSPEKSTEGSAKTVDGFMKARRPMSRKEQQSAEGGRAACQVCLDAYKLAGDGQKKADRVAILPTCKHHFHSACLKERFLHQQQLRHTSRPRLPALKFVVVNCPRCLHPYPLASPSPSSSSSWSACWSKFRKKCARFFRKLFRLNPYPKAYKPQKPRPLEIDKFL
ncbi:hypothetical protein PGT21_016022 [Puccinia graminis f. sp. tritici]|uniref:RING-type domain-containing protein n=2 Tax=Puccinia graminis f. sp. tritici TaxID=56615 RepID=A0A5B0NXP5_PUCGR|nr:hypothetical protein PGT21_016022 [Puccinia graminis f. sp. tritici]KAA1093512.1 hypothetical protein PGTUg99_024026 [Puccinia graminis f. sp. tritici]